MQGLVFRLFNTYPGARGLGIILTQTNILPTSTLKSMRNHKMFIPPYSQSVFLKVSNGLSSDCVCLARYYTDL